MKNNRFNRMAARGRMGVPIGRRCVSGVSKLGNVTAQGVTETEEGDKVQAQPGLGDTLEATVTYASLPATNNGFGEKTVKLVYDGGNDRKLEVSGKFEVFFQRDAKDHPGDGSGTTPNWYFYWSQTSANALNGVALEHDYDVKGRSYCNFINGRWQAMICDDVVNSPTRVWGGTPWKRRWYDPGIYKFAFNVRHEERHRLDFIDLWKGQARNPDNDKDGDCLPDDLERESYRQPRSGPFANRPYLSLTRKSYPDRWLYGSDWSDAEDWALLRQSYPEETGESFEHEDWANPGTQFGKKH